MARSPLAGRAYAQAALAFLLLARGASCVPPAPRLKTALELRVEQAIEAAYARCFRTYLVAGRELTLRIPFGQNGERRGTPGFVQRIFLGGKGDPEQIWEQVDAILASPDFDRYVRRLRRPGEKVVVFDLEQGSSTVYADPVMAGMLREGPYPGDRTLVYVLKAGDRVEEADVYDYLYCVGSLGMDCSGFIYYLQRAVAAALGVDLDAALARELGVPAQRLPQAVGLWLFNPQFLHATQAPAVPGALRPGDVFLFRGQVPGRGLDFRHSAVIQAIDPEAGRVRYLQCTDWAPRGERGVHESTIHYDPGRPGASLKDPSARWSQEILPTFPGEPGLRYWRNDGDRFRSYAEQNGSLVVRLDLVSRLLTCLEPDYYRRLEPPPAPDRGQQPAAGPRPDYSSDTGSTSTSR